MAGLVVGQGDKEGWTLGYAAADLVGQHGVVSAQIANIAVVSGSVTTNTTQLQDALIVAVNAIIGALTNKGNVAAS